MRSFTSGSGSDTTATVKAHLASNPQPLIYTFVKIQLVRWATIPQAPGIPFTPFFKTEWLLTDFPAAVNYAPIGDFAAANIKHGNLPFQPGLDFGSFDIMWTPQASDIVSPAYTTLDTTLTTTPITAFQGVEGGFWDGAFIYVYKVVMPTAGDANTYGATLLTMGTVEDVTIDGLELQFHVGCPIDAQDGQIPSQLISSNSRFAAMDSLMYTDVRYTSFIARCLPETPVSTINKLVSFDYGSPLVIPPTGFFDGGVVMWYQGPLAGMRRPIRRSISTPAETRIDFYLAQPFPFDQSVYVKPDGQVVGYRFAAYPLTSLQASDSFYNGFKYVPIPEDGL